MATISSTSFGSETLEIIAFRLHDQEFCVKTTTIRDVVGFRQPTAGRIVIEGTDLTTLRGEALRQFRRTVQLVYQNPFSSLDPRQTIFQIIEEPLLNFDPLPAAERARRVHDILARVGLPPTVLERRPRALSGGQRQRVAIARALVTDPTLLVCDEPTGDLDRKTADEVLTLLQQLNREFGKTIVMVTHDPKAADYAKHTVHLDKGTLVDVPTAGAH